MRVLKGLGIFVCLLFFLSTICSCGDDYKESGIEGQWRLRQVEAPDGKRSDVDTIFYSFKKNVFKYTKLKTQTQTFSCYGNYSISDSKLKIEISRDSFEPKDDDSELDWSDLTRTYTVKNQTSSVLELEYGGSVYYFGKY